MIFWLAFVLTLFFDTFWFQIPVIITSSFQTPARACVFFCACVKVYSIVNTMPFLPQDGARLSPFEVRSEIVYNQWSVWIDKFIRSPCSRRYTAESAQKFTLSVWCNFFKVFFCKVMLMRQIYSHLIIERD